MSPVNRAVTISGASAAAVNFTATPITYSISGTITVEVGLGDAEWSSEWRHGHGR